MDYKKDLLLRSAARLYSLGIEVESAREQLRKLVKKGVPYDSPEMRKALEEFQELDRQWKALEQEHLQLRAEVVRETKTAEQILTFVLSCHIITSVNVNCLGRRMTA